MEFTLISSNMFLLPQPISVDNKKRIKLFTDLCLVYKPHFVLLQEVWLNNLVSLIKIQLDGYYFIGKSDLLYNKTGLMMFSKYKPLNYMKRSFSRESGSALYDSLAQKGYIYAQFLINNTKVSVLNVHLNCPYRQGQKTAWENQLKTIDNLISGEDNALIVAGDFNGSCDRLLKNSSPINNMNSGIKSFSLANLYRNRGFHKFTKRFLRTEIDESDLDIDHVLLFTKNIKSKITKRFILEPQISDHYPIFAEISY